MKIYISLPISGLNIDTCKERANRIKKKITQKGHEAITPFDVCPSTQKTYAYYMGKYIQAIIQCDTIFLLSGWSESASCNLEWRCAQIYNKPIFQHLNHIPDGRAEAGNT